MSVVRRQYQIYIERPVAVVFGFLTDLKNHARLALPAQPEEALTQLSGPLTEGVCITYDRRPLQVSHPRSRGAARPAYVRRASDRRGVLRRGRTAAVAPPFQEGTLLTEILEYELPAGFLGALANRAYLGKTVDDWVRHRQSETKRILERIGRIKGPGK